MLKTIKLTFFNDILPLYVITWLRYPFGENQIYLSLVLAILVSFTDKNGKPFNINFITNNIKFILVKQFISIFYVLFLWYVVIHNNSVLNPTTFPIIGVFFYILFLIINIKLWR
jgi:hypothetical protein